MRLLRQHRSFHCAVLPKTREPTKEELIAALMLLHVIRNPAETLSDADMQFLTNIVALLNDWFGRPESPVKSPQLGDILSPTSNTPKKQLKTVFRRFGNFTHQTQWVQKIKKNLPFRVETTGFVMVRVTGFEPAASCSQSRRATNCATPG